MTDRAPLQRVNPELLGAPKGYSNGVLAPAGGRLLFVAGQVAWNREHRIVCDDFPGQFHAALANVLEVVRAAGGGPEHVARFTVYVTDRQEYLADLALVGARYRDVMGRNFPAMALVEVKALLEPGAKVEIEATAVIP
ncbi:MAG: RidA family protein [Planctomycetales bacterium]|nr:RidA family protein [Planctomycetales bacterium]